MKFTRLLKAVLISAGMTAGTICVVLPSALHGSQCNTEATTLQDCISAGQQNWYSWFQGKSRSTQFHFIDLLELLSRLSPTQKS